MTPNVRRLTVEEAKLLLYMGGFRSAYGFLAAEASNGAETACRLAKLAAEGVLKTEGSSWEILPPYREWIPQWGSARRVLRVQVFGEIPGAACLYPGRKGFLACSVCRGSPEILRLRSVSLQGLPDWLTEECGFPEWEELVFPPSEISQPVDCGEEEFLKEEADGASMEGCLGMVSCICLPEDTEVNRLLAIQRPLNRELLATGDGGPSRFPYSRDRLEGIITAWLGGIE